MKPQRIIDILNSVDPKYIAESAPGNKSGIKNKHPYLKRFLFSAAILLLIAAMCFTTIAAVNYDLGFYISSIFGGDLTLLDEITAAPKNVKYKSTNDAASLEVTGLTGDRNYIYVWIEVTLPDGMSDQYDDYILSFGDYTLNNTGTTRSVAFDGNKSGDKYAFGLLLSCDEDKSLIGRRVKITFSDIYLVPADGSFFRDSVLVAGGVWKISLTLAIPDLAKVYTPDVSGKIIKTIDFDDSQYSGSAIKNGIMEQITVDNCKIEVSPMSIRLEFDYANTTGEFFSAPKKITLQFSDGSEKVFNIISFASRYSGKKQREEKRISTVFSEPINTSEITAIIYGDLVIPINSAHHN